MPALTPPVTFVPHRPSGAVFASAQTPDGYMWFGTLTGLYRFDGVRYERFSPKTTPLFTHARINHLAVTTDGRLWVASGHPGPGRGSWERGGPGLWVLQDGRFQSRSAGLPSPWVMALTAGPNNELWVGTHEGLAVINDDAVTKLGWPPNTDHAVYHVRPDAKGRVWVGAQTGLSRFAAGAFTLVIPKFFALFSSQGPDKGLWMTNMHDVYRLPADADEWQVWTNGKAVGVAQIRAVAQDAGGTVWVGGSGIAAVDSKTMQGTPPPALDGSADPDRLMILSLFADREGGVWAGSREAGVFQGMPARVANYGKREGMPGDVGFNVLGTADGFVYLAFGSGMMRVYDDKFESLPQTNDAPERPVHGMAQAPDGAVWMADYSSNLYRFDGVNYSKFKVTHKGQNGTATTLAFDPQGQLWVAWDEGGVSWFEPSTLAVRELALTERGSLGVADGLCGGRHLVGTARKQGGAWFGGYQGGISQVTNSSATCIKEGLPEGSLMGLHEEPDGALFFGINGVAGLFRRKDGRISRYTHGLQTSPFGITSDGAGNLWFGSAAGAFKVKRAFLDAAERQMASPSEAATAPIPWLAFTYEDGLRSEESFGGTSPAAAVGHDGRFWFPSLRGVSAVADPDRLGSPFISPPFVERIRANGREVHVSSVLEIPAGPGTLDITYTSPAFTLPHQLAFEYKLAGFDKDWVQAHGRRTAFYTNLPPRKYQFLLRVRRGAGQPVQSKAPLRIAFAPYFYERPIFYVLVALILGGIVFLIHRLRLAQLEARHSIIHVERARLARELHDHLGQGFTAIGFALDALRSRLKGNDSARVAEQARGLLEHCQTETRRLVWDLRSEAERHPDLESALREVVQRAHVEGGPRVALATEGQSRVSGLARHELPLIAQEAITNALRHAKAKTISVVLASSATQTTVTVTDDGQGFPPQPGGGMPTRAGHFGMVGMEERARRLHAALLIHSGPGVGTEVSITVPNVEERTDPGSLQ